MPKLSLTLINGEEEVEIAISSREAKFIRDGFTTGSPFSFTDDDGEWVWFNPDAFAGISIEEDE